MAQKGVKLDTESISCSICLDVLKDPVTIPCGHSYCMSCIKAHFDGEDQKGLHSCPQCREKFIPRPVLVKNTMFADLVEQLKKTGLQPAPADHCYAGPEDVACDFCSGRKLRASKSCLVCVASYCEEHLQPHYDVAPLKKHKLVEPSKKLQENICSVHDEVKKLFCRTDQKSICVVCAMDEHKGHHTVSAAAERTERQRELEGRRQQIQKRIQDKKNDVDLLQQEVEAIDQSADKTVEDSEKMFAELIRLIQNRRSDVEQQVRSQQQTAVRGVKELQQELQQEITELQRKDAELQQLSHTEDHVQFLTSCPSLPALSEPTHSSSIRERPLRYFEDVTAAVSELTDKLQHILTQDWTKVSLAAAQPDVLLPPEPESRADFLRCSRRITLDPNTAHVWLLLSEGNRKVTWRGQQSYPDHPDRFTGRPQVLSRESLTGRCYWEVERRGEYGGVVSVAVAYKNISREGIESGFGYNDKSWALYCYENSSTFRFNRIETSLSAPPSSRVGVYLDHRAGILSFYSVSETRTLLHRVQTTFTQPLYAGLYVYWPGSSAELCELRFKQLPTAEMAQKGVQLDTETFSCSICLEVLKDPVTIPCGHSYCLRCIKAHFDGEDQKGLHSCPQCRKHFIPRPVLEKNTMFAALVEQLKKTGLQAAPADHCYAGPEDVACDVCSGRKLRASKSCLSCVASYCEEHLQPHYESPTFKKHKLVEPSKKLQENICSVHDEVKKLFCRTDQKSICVVCAMDEHKGHHTVSVAAERTERQRELEGRRQQIQQRIQDKKREVDLLQQEVEAIDQSADKTVEDSEKTFAELIRLIQNRRSDVEQQVRSQQQTAVRGVKELQQELQQEITELQRKDAELQQLSHTEDHVQFLTSCPSLPALGESTHSSSIRERPLSCFEDVTAAVSELTDKLQHILTQDWTKVSLAAAQLDVLLPPEPESRADFLRCSRKITLDPNTAHSYLLLSEGNRKVIVMKKPQSYPDHPDRFTDWCQVLSRESLTGRCYWEVERRGRAVTVAVAYKNISRKGNESRFGYNDKSWALYCGGNSCTFKFNNIKTSLSAPPSSRVGVYLDHRAGILSFYSVSETRTLLHRVQTTFTQPLYAGLWVGSSAELCELR
ncbi:uncharacterized protein ACNS7B_017269 [Menidia menidia]